jgi:CheY-like chemotaxis protein
VGLEGIRRGVFGRGRQRGRHNTLHELLDLDGLMSPPLLYDGCSRCVARNLSARIVVMDIGMPGMDGYDAARLIHSCGAGMVLIAVTG